MQQDTSITAKSPSNPQRRLEIRSSKGGLGIGVCPDGGINHESGEIELCRHKPEQVRK